MFEKVWKTIAVHGRYAISTTRRYSYTLLVAVTACPVALSYGKCMSSKSLMSLPGGCCELNQIRTLRKRRDRRAFGGLSFLANAQFLHSPFSQTHRFPAPPCHKSFLASTVAVFKPTMSRVNPREFRIKSENRSSPRASGEGILLSPFNAEMSPKRYWREERSYT